jgi:hypothetical protein
MSPALLPYLLLHVFFFAFPRTLKKEKPKWQGNKIVKECAKRFREFQTSEENMFDKVIIQVLFFNSSFKKLTLGEGYEREQWWG